MHLPLGTFSPDVKLGLVSASRNCFPRSLSEKRTVALLKECSALKLRPAVPSGRCAIIESKDDAHGAADQLNAAGCDAAVLYLGNFSPEIEDAVFVKAFRGPVMMIAAAEESADTLLTDRGDALCGLLSAVLAVTKRGIARRVFIPQQPLLDAKAGAAHMVRFVKVMKVYKGVANATLGLFGPRPRDFETCNYNVACLASVGAEVEELGFFDLVNEIRAVHDRGEYRGILSSMRKEMSSIPPDDFGVRLATYEKAVRNFHERLKLSGMTSQCWSEQEFSLKHVPCYINARMAAKGFPIACENDAYSLLAELMGQYASDEGVTILDINHTIPANLDKSLDKYPLEDVVGLFHCGNTHPGRLLDACMKHQVIMKRLMEPEGEPDITRGTIEGTIAPSPLTLVQVGGAGDSLRAYLAEGEFLNLDPKTFGGVGTAYLPGFARLYRHALLGRFHHHTAAAFAHCGGILFDAMKLLGIAEIHTPLPKDVPYPGENPFAA